MPVSKSDVVSAIYSEPSTHLSLRQKQQLSQEIQGLSPYELKRLLTLIRGAGGAGVGFLIAKYLLGLGKRSTILSMIVGGIAGAMSSFPGGGRPTTFGGYRHGVY